MGIAALKCVVSCGFAKFSATKLNTHYHKYIMRNFSGLYNAMYLLLYVCVCVCRQCQTPNNQMSCAEARPPHCHRNIPPFVWQNMRGKIRAEVSFGIPLVRDSPRDLYSCKMPFICWRTSGRAELDVCVCVHISASGIDPGFGCMPCVHKAPTYELYMS